MRRMQWIIRTWAVLAAGFAMATAALGVGLALAASPPARAAAGPPAAGRTVVTFGWGGGNADQLQALPWFRRYGWHGTYYVPSGLVCIPSRTVNCAGSRYLSLPDLRMLAADGNEIGGLTVAHQHLTGLPAAEAQREICNDRVNLTRWGFTVTDFAYPYAVVTPRSESLVRRCGYDSGLGAGQVAGAGTCEKCGLYA